MVAKRHTALAAVGLLLMTACASTDEDATDETPADQQVPQNETAATQEATEAPDDDVALDQQQDVTLSMDDAVQTITYPMQGEDGEITMGIFEPVVQGDAMLLSIVFQPEFESASAESIFQNLHGDQANSVLAPVISDRENLKAYNVPRETTNQYVQGGGWLGGTFAAGTWASAIGDVEVRSGEEYIHWAYFPTPEDDIDTVDIAVIPGAQEFRDVPINWDGDAPQAPGNDDEE